MVVVALRGAGEVGVRLRLALPERDLAVVMAALVLHLQSPVLA